MAAMQTGWHIRRQRGSDDGDESDRLPDLITDRHAGRQLDDWRCKLYMREKTTFIKSAGIGGVYLARPPGCRRRPRTARTPRTPDGGHVLDKV